MSKNTSNLSVRERLLNMGVSENDIDHHESDLYVKKTKVSEEFVNSYEFKCNVTTFVDDINKEVWYDIPFGYISEHMRMHVI